MKPFTVTPFKPYPIFTTGHTQSLAGNFLRSKKWISLRRKRLDTPDGDFVDIDFADVRGASWAQLGEGAPIVLVLHGLEGSSNSGYMYESYRQLAKMGLRPVGINHRSCSEQMNRTLRLYHAGFTDDILLVLAYLKETFPTVPIGLMGFSLGANMLLKLLGQSGEEALAAAGVAISPPFDMVKGSAIFNEGEGKFYSRVFLRRLQQKVRVKLTQFPDEPALHAALQAKTVWEFDDVATAPLFGFAGADDYYRRNGSGQFLGAIARPTLILRSLDDPFFANDVPLEVIERNPNVVAELTQYGGHCAFVGRGNNGRFQFWSEQQGARFLASQLYG